MNKVIPYTFASEILLSINTEVNEAFDPPFWSNYWLKRRINAKIKYRLHKLDCYLDNTIGSV